MGYKAPAASGVPVEHAARVLGVSRQRVHQLMDAGLLPYVRIGRYRLPTMSGVQAHLENGGERGKR